MLDVIYFFLLAASTEARPACLYTNVSKRLVLDINTCLIGTRKNNLGVKVIDSISQEIKNTSAELVEITYILEPEFKNRTVIFHENELISGSLPTIPTDGFSPSDKSVTYSYAALAPGESLILVTRISEILPKRKENNGYAIFFDILFDFRYESETRGQILTRTREDLEEGKHSSTFNFKGLNLSWK
jgi:hypothetical protein